MARMISVSDPASTGGRRSVSPMDGGSTTIGGIVIPSTDPIFLAVVVGVHIPLGIVCVVTGACAMLSRKGWAAFELWHYLFLVPAGPFCIGNLSLCHALVGELSLVHFGCCRLLAMVWSFGAPITLGALG